MTDLTLEVAKELFEYDANAGVLRWRKGGSKYSAVKSGDVAGCVHANGYRIVMVNRKHYRVHRIVYLLANGAVPQFIDHINGCKDDNRLENLRAASKAENARNSKLKFNNSSGIKGVGWNEPTKKWLSQIKLNGRKYSKTFSLLEEAQEWVEFVRVELHGSFANHGVMRSVK